MYIHFMYKKCSNFSQKQEQEKNLELHFINFNKQWQRMIQNEQKQKKKK